MDNPEEEFLNTFFTLVSQLNFEKAKEIAEREREPSRPGMTGTWGVLLSLLVQVSAAEKSYVDLGFLLSKNKGFLRKDTSLRSTYDNLRSDLRRLEDIERLNNDRLVGTVANHTAQFITARIELIDFYEKMQAMGTKQMRYDELLTHIEDIISRHVMSFTHMVLTSVKATLSLECEILLHLLHAQLEMQQWNFLSSLMLLHKANTRISAWEQTLQNRDSWKLGFGANFLKVSQTPALFQWLIKLKAASVAKFSLYFISTLAQQTSAQDLKVLQAKQSCDYLHKIQVFQKRCDATAVMLVLDNHLLANFQGSGYHLPDTGNSHTSAEAYHIIASYPLKPLNHMPNIIKVLTEKASELAAMDKVVYYFSSKDQSTYVTATVDPRISLVVVFDSKKAEKDGYVGNFISELSSQLRCNHVFANLKLNTK